MQTVTCCECGSQEELTWDQDLNARFLKLKLCFTCNHWQDRITHYGPASVIIDGEHYMIGSEDDDYPSRGHGGQRFRIKFNDGREVVTTNLWHQGKIPEHYRDRLPDNAVWVPVTR